jgi:phage/plasmid-associated DNA primase
LPVRAGAQRLASLHADGERRIRRGAACPQWRARLDLLHRDPVARVAIQRIYGMTLTALVSDQAFYVFQGKGGDGKSMTNSIVADLQGDYFRSTSPQTFLEGKQRNASDHQSDIVRLRGDIRLVVCDEPKARSVWNGERIKQVTGSLITARAPNAVEEITFKPHWKLICECNPLPGAERRSGIPAALQALSVDCPIRASRPAPRSGQSISCAPSCSRRRPASSTG